MTNYNNYLIKALSDKGMTQRELAEKTGLTEVTISRYMAGKRVPNIRNLIPIVNALEIDVNEMFGLKRMTNADRIRAMSDEELADFIASDQCCMIAETWNVDLVLEWLHREAKESEEE